ncbi:MAG: DUF898 domain-containing protein [Methylococcales bacterium]|nr:DUF898 domain-containing protein [Methylococcales bacterium]
MQKNTQQFEFHGKAGEFFKIWIVNMMLSIITLGIYSAWAKVRTRKYFYNNTLLMNTPFDYLADPIKILKGRLIVLAIFLIYLFSELISPMVQGILLLLFILSLPWVIIRAMIFNMYNSAYRNIRFHFSAKYLTALWVFLGLPFLVALSLGLAYPYFIKEQKKFIIDHTTYGTSPFNMDASVGSIYSIFFKMIGIFLLLAILIGVVGVIADDLGSYGEMLKNPATMGTPLIFVSLAIIPFYIFAVGYWHTNLINLIINHTTLQQSQLTSELQTIKICWIFVSNTLAIIFSLGLLIPWAMIRTTKYRISCMSLITNSDPDAFIAAESEQAAAIGEEAGDFLDIDLGL